MTTTTMTTRDIVKGIVNDGQDVRPIFNLLTDICAQLEGKEINMTGEKWTKELFWSAVSECVHVNQTMNNSNQ